MDKLVGWTDLMSRIDVVGRNPESIKSFWLDDILSFPAKISPGRARRLHGTLPGKEVVLHNTWHLILKLVRRLDWMDDQGVFISLLGLVRLIGVVIASCEA